MPFIIVIKIFWVYDSLRFFAGNGEPLGFLFRFSSGSPENPGEPQPAVLFRKRTGSLPEENRNLPCRGTPISGEPLQNFRRISSGSPAEFPQNFRRREPRVFLWNTREPQPPLLPESGIRKKPPGKPRVPHKRISYQMHISKKEPKR
jgi:hypothetical protein